MTMEAYQLWPPDTLVVSQISSEVQMIHEFENESKRVFPSGIDANERYETPTVIVEVATCQRFLVQPLPWLSANETQCCRGASHSPRRRVNSLMRNGTCGI